MLENTHNIPPTHTPSLFHTDQIQAALQYHKIRKAKRACLSELMQNPGMRTSGGCVGDGQHWVLESVLDEVCRLLPECPKLENIRLSAPGENTFACPIAGNEYDELCAYGKIKDGGDGAEFCTAVQLKAIATAVRSLPPAFPLKEIDLDGFIFYYSVRPVSTLLVKLRLWRRRSWWW